MAKNRLSLLTLVAVFLGPVVAYLIKQCASFVGPSTLLSALVIGSQWDDTKLVDAQGAFSFSPSFSPSFSSFSPSFGGSFSFSSFSFSSFSFSFSSFSFGFSPSFGFSSYSTYSTFGFSCFGFGGFGCFGGVSYSHYSGGGGGGDIIPLLFICCLICFCCWLFSKSSQSAPRPPPGGYRPPVHTPSPPRQETGQHMGQSPQTHDEFVKGGTQNAPMEFPSGNWKGFYTHGDPRAGPGKHEIMPFQMGANPGSDFVSGHGCDDIGTYTVAGKFGNSTHRVAYSKTYQRGSPNMYGMVERANMGHTVEYRGTFSGTTNIKGRWSIRLPGVINDGEFELMIDPAFAPSAPPAF